MTEQERKALIAQANKLLRKNFSDPGIEQLIIGDGDVGMVRKGKTVPTGGLPRSGGRFIRKRSRA